MKRLQTQSLPIQISQYLIETNPEFTIKENFISSNYMLERIGFSPDEHIKKLGDAFYEQQLIRDQIFEQSGRVLLNKEVNNQQEQYEQLMNNAVELFESSKGSDLELTPGISLSKEQIDALTSDIVWMEEKIINNQIVLVPQVYLANPESYKIAGGKILANEDINLKVNKLLNGGLFEAGGDLIVSADTTIENNGGTFQSDNDLKLTAVNNITNTSGTISGGDVALTSTNGSIINQRFKKDLDFSKNGDINKKTLIGREAKIISRNSLSIDAKNKFQNLGSSLSSQGNTLIKAKDVEITTIEDKQEYRTGSSKNYIHTGSTKHIASNIDAKNLTVIAEDKVDIIGTNIKTNHAYLEGDEVNVKTINDESFSESRTSSRRMFGSQSDRITQATSTNVANQINTNQLSIKSNKRDITLEANQINTKKLLLDSANNVNFEDGYDGVIDETEKVRNRLFTPSSFSQTKQTIDNRLQKTAVANQINTKEISIKAKTVNTGSTNITYEKMNLDVDTLNTNNTQNIDQTTSTVHKSNVSWRTVAEATGAGALGGFMIGGPAGALAGAIQGALDSTGIMNGAMGENIHESGYRSYSGTQTTTTKITQNESVFNNLSSNPNDSNINVANLNNESTKIDENIVTNSDDVNQIETYNTTTIEDKGYNKDFNHANMMLYQGTKAAATVQTGKYIGGSESKYTSETSTDLPNVLLTKEKIPQVIPLIGGTLAEQFTGEKIIESSIESVNQNPGQINKPENKENLFKEINKEIIIDEIINKEEIKDDNQTN